MFLQKRLGEVEEFCCFADERILTEVSLSVGKAGLAPTNLRHLLRRDIRLPIKSQLYTAAARLVLFYDSETWSLETEYIQRPPVFEHRCPHGILGMFEDFSTFTKLRNPAFR